MKCISGFCFYPIRTKECLNRNFKLLQNEKFIIYRFWNENFLVYLFEDVSFSNLYQVTERGSITYYYHYS